ncbi:hypothetical protein JKP88DRAFT_281719 [Tribonema minus]|uniref:Uncharacterized protein n=1 Tax=Tribonema minus TaxID=303371 RepID=A0A835YV85_9STRA|nr:hypothetical protein JKP88DRAFT_281719 [Tribonema minus]
MDDEKRAFGGDTSRRMRTTHDALDLDAPLQAIIALACSHALTVCALDGIFGIRGGILRCGRLLRAAALRTMNCTFVARCAHALAQLRAEATTLLAGSNARLLGGSSGGSGGSSSGAAGDLAAAAAAALDPGRCVVAKYEQHQKRARRAPTKVIAEACPGLLSKAAAARPTPAAAAAEAASSMAAALATDAGSAALTAPLLDALLAQGELCAQLAVATASAGGRGGAGNSGSQIGGGSSRGSSKTLQNHDKVVQLARSALTEAMLSADERGGSSGLRVAARARVALARVHLARTPQQQASGAGASVRATHSAVAAARRLLTWITEHNEPSVAALRAQVALLLASLPPLPAAAADHDDSDALPWCDERCEVKADGCVAGVYRVPATAVEGGDVTRDAEECRKACGQFYHLLVTAAGTVTRVDVYEASSEVREAYQDKRRELSAQGKSADETRVLHGTRRENVERICAAGFKVGTQGVADSWKPHSDWCIFKTGQQLLPVYVVHYSGSRR